MERAVGHGLAARPWKQEAGSPYAHVRAPPASWPGRTPARPRRPISMTYAAVPALRADDAIAKVDPAARVHGLTTPASGSPRPAGRAGRHGDDREAGRLGRPHNDAGAADVGRRQVHPPRAASGFAPDERRVPAGPGARRLTASWCRRCSRTARATSWTSSGLGDKLGNRLQRVLRARVRRHRRPAAGRRGPGCGPSSRWSPRPAGLRAGVDLVDAASRQRGHLARIAPLRVRIAARRQAARCRTCHADLAVDEAATALAMRLAAAVDGIADPHEVALRRIALLLSKFWVCKRTLRSSPRRWSAWAATATSRVRSPAALPRGALNSVWEGRATSTRSTSCARARSRAGGPRRVDHRGRPGPWRGRPSGPRRRRHPALLGSHGRAGTG